MANNKPVANPNPNPNPNPPTVPVVPPICADDLAVDQNSALIFSEKAPLPVTAQIKNARGVRIKDDYKAVWTFVPASHDPSLLMFFHGNNGYVTVDSAGKSRPPDWADAAGTLAASQKQATEFGAGLNQLKASQDALPADATTVTKMPIVFVPEDAELSTSGYWSVPPRGQYGGAATVGTTQLQKLVMNCYEHLRCLKAPSAGPYLPSGQSGSWVSNLKRFYLVGHSGGGKPLVESAGADLVRISPTSIDLATDLWLLDCTYGFGTDNYVSFCQNWKSGNKLKLAPGSSRFVCVYRPKSNAGDTETEADVLRTLIATQVLGVNPASIKKDLTPLTGASAVLAAITGAGPVLFLRTNVDHPNIPKKFIPMLLRTAAS